MAAIDAVALLLQDEGLGTVGTSIFEEHMPDQPDASIVVIDTGGGPPGLTQGDDTDTPSWQIIVRDPDPAAAVAAMQTAFQALHGLTEQTVHGEHFKLVWALQSNPVSLGRDEKQRFRFVMNFRAFFAGAAR